MIGNSLLMKNSFWESKSFQQMSESEWESLCDGCGKCCVYQLEDEDQVGQGVYYPTNVSCRYLDSDLCRCTAYDTRKKLVADCMKITPQNVAELDWLPSSCAYRRVFFQQPLPEWHYLVTGDKMSIHNAGASVSGRCIADNEAGDLEDHIVIWDNF